MGLKIMRIRYLGCGKVTANEKVVGIYFVTTASIMFGARVLNRPTPVQLELHCTQSNISKLHPKKRDDPIGDLHMTSSKT